MNPTRSKADITRWNRDVVLGMAFEYGYEVKQHCDTHMSLIHPTKGRMDFWPTAGKCGWFHGNKMYGKAFKVEDIEAYIMRMFNPNATKHIESDKSRADRYEKALMQISNGCATPQRIANIALTPKTESDET